MSFCRALVCVLAFFIFFPAGAARSLDLMLPLVYEEKTDVTGWLMSEKLDGVRGYWDGRNLLSKNGFPFQPHPEFVKNFPPFPVEGEIWGGRGTFAETSGRVRTQKATAGWLDLQFAIFDAPEAPGGIEERLAAVRKWFQAHPSSCAFVIAQSAVENTAHLQAELHRVEGLGGEGLILRRPGSLYVTGRSADILKVKSYSDAEAVVIDALPGTGRNKERMGSLLVELPDTKIRFKIGTGFSDGERENPPLPGSVISFKYYGWYDSGLPKFPSFLRIRP